MALEDIPIIQQGMASAPTDDQQSSGSECDKREPYALMNLGNSMEPEFMDGDVIVIEPEHPPYDGAYVIAWHNEEFIFRQLLIRGDEWVIHPLNPAYPDQPLSGPDDVRGVITQKKSPGGRKNRKSYGPFC